jgi:hypothetical protein
MSFNVENGLSICIMDVLLFLRMRLANGPGARPANLINQSANANIREPDIPQQLANWPVPLFCHNI